MRPITHMYKCGNGAADETQMLARKASLEEGGLQLIFAFQSGNTAQAREQQAGRVRGPGPGRPASWRTRAPRTPPRATLGPPSALCVRGGRGRKEQKKKKKAHWGKTPKLPSRERSGCWLGLCESPSPRHF